MIPHQRDGDVMNDFLFFTGMNRTALQTIFNQVIGKTLCPPGPAYFLPLVITDFTIQERKFAELNSSGRVKINRPGVVGREQGCRNRVFKTLPGVFWIQRFDRNQTGVKIDQSAGEIVVGVFDVFCLEILITLPMQKTGEFGLILSSIKKKIKITYKTDYNLNVGWVSCGSQNDPIPRSEETLKIHIFIDKSIIETFFNYISCITNRIYPKKNENLTISMYSKRNKVEITSIEIWKLKSIW